MAPAATWPSPWTPSARSTTAMASSTRRSTLAWPSTSAARRAAEALFAESFDLARRTGMRSNIAYALIGLAMVGRGGVDPGWSARLHGAADQALAELGHPLQPLEARLADLN